MFSGLNQRSTEAPHQSEGTGGSFFQEPLWQRAHQFQMMLLLFPLSQQHHSRSKTISQAPWMNWLLCTLRKRCLFPSSTRKPSKNVFFGTVFLTQTFSSKSAWKDITYRSKWISSTSSPAFFFVVVVLPWSKRKKVDTKDRKSRDDRMKLDGGDSCRLSRWRLLIRRVWRLKTIQTTHGTRIPTERHPPPLSHALESATIIAAGSVSLKCRQVAESPPSSLNSKRLVWNCSRRTTSQKVEALQRIYQHLAASEASDW